MRNRSLLGRGGPAGALLLAFAALTAVFGCRTAAPAGQDSPRPCGLYRWRVKTLSDGDAERVRLEPMDMSIHDLVHLPRSRREPHGRRRSEELQTYRVQGVLLAVQSRRDKDLHLLLSDPSDSKSRLIAEIPKPSCSMRSFHEDKFASARGAAESLRGKPHGTLVEVVGVGFFDIGHIQKGRSHNGLELHPVLSVAAIEPAGL